MPRLPSRVFAVLKEDVYETVFGDGYYAHLVAAFRTHLAAEGYVATRDDEHVNGAETTGYRYHIVELEIETQKGRAQILNPPGSDDGTVTVDRLRTLLG
jgi:hypothetical protein